ncbi:urease accessory UreF family protein [Pseudofrankia saprophytica]|uniref:urease accessory UreF family protein n=1 Tax=Pseudofrankia saprophytica TaxID=298655 RepID=UPI00055E37B6|nr:urease accessory UreF family protein [Pseudofrankia saprophytica]
MSGERRPAARAALLVLADGRLPAGGHAHSGGVEAAVVDGGVTGLDDLAAFLLGRLGTTGLVAASFAAAACWTCRIDTAAPAAEAPAAEILAAEVGELAGAPDTPAAGQERAARLAALDAELDARTPSPAQRDASRAQGRTLLRAGRAAWDLSRIFPPNAGGSATGARQAPAPHHPIALGVVAAAAGLEPADAALAAAYGAVGGPASAATRLLGLDPLAVTGLQAKLADAMEATAAEATAAAEAAMAMGRPDLLPAPSAVRLDLLAERHRAAPVRMFTS